MAPLDDTTPEARFDSFTIYRTSYKEISSQSINVVILTPKTLRPGKHPILVKFHGGGLVTGDCLYAPWFAAYFVPFIHRANAIVVSPNYRLVPEHTGADILEDLTDFWGWLRNGGLASYLASQNVVVDLDFEHILASGDSAGGYMALMSGLLQPKGSIKAVLAQYPMTDSLRRDKSELFIDLQSPPASLVDEHMKSVRPGVVVSSCVPPERMNLSYVLSAYGRYLEFFGGDKMMWPLYLIEEKKWLPPTWIHHGDVDTAVSIEDSKAFVAKCEAIAGLEVRLEVLEGKDHGFDTQAKEDEEPWLKEGLRWVEKKWLQ
ncbi:alpha/beta-hydrolase [Macroventuria anomochaeta]|uniref:Alpha/beta-hydrolase n=1 Tax=Macroventuria anomochaeta TaxID=301207 RepID=A0ACB6SBZ9_9PLEO|nr:alpha/beta-hydrolase [Macroventuria anomochaeta]KAF2631498.1 alpha/beta-hydrolase [Macroventuria anomochaeta]